MIGREVQNPKGSLGSPFILLWRSCLARLHPFLAALVERSLRDSGCSDEGGLHVGGGGKSEQVEVGASDIGQASVGQVIPELDARRQPRAANCNRHGSLQQNRQYSISSPRGGSMPQLAGSKLVPQHMSMQGSTDLQLSLRQGQACKDMLSASGSALNTSYSGPQCNHARQED